MPLGDLVISDPLSQWVWRFTGWSGTSEDAFSAGSHPKAVVDFVESGEPNRFLVIDTVDDHIQQLWGFGEPLKDSLDPRPNEDEFGLDWQVTGPAMYTTSGGAVAEADRKCWQYDGFSSTVDDSLDHGIGVDRYSGCAFDESAGDPGDFIFGNYLTSYFYLCAGFSTTIDDSFAMTTSEGTGGGYGCFWDPTDSPESFNWLQRKSGTSDILAMKMEGFSSTVADSIAWVWSYFGITTAPRGMCATNAIETQYLNILSTTAGGDTVWGRDIDDWKLLLELDESADVVFDADAVLAIFGLPTPRFTCQVQGRDLPAEMVGRDLPAETAGRAVPEVDADDRDIDVEDYPSPRKTNVGGQSC